MIFMFCVLSVAGNVSLPDAVAAWETCFLHFGENEVRKKLCQLAGTQRLRLTAVSSSANLQL